MPENAFGSLFGSLRWIAGRISWIMGQFGTLWKILNVFAKVRSIYLLVRESSRVKILFPNGQLADPEISPMTMYMRNNETHSARA